MISAFSLEALVSVLVLVLAYFLAHRYWRHKALARATAWAVTENLTILSRRPMRFTMHRQRPRIAFLAAEPSGKTYACTLQLKSSSIFVGPLHESAAVQVLEQVELPNAA